MTILSEVDKQELEAYIAGTRDIILLTPVEERELARKIVENDDQEAKNELYMRNRRLVVTIAMRNLEKIDGAMSLGDLLQEGDIGLMRAVDGIEINKGKRFSSYAGEWIDGNINRAIENLGSLIRVPVYTFEIYALIKPYLQMWERKGEDIDYKKLAYIANGREKPIDMDGKIQTIKAIIRNHQSSRVDFLYERGKSSKLDLGIKFEDATIKISEMKEEYDRVLKYLDKLKITPRDKLIFVLRYGLEGREPMTHRQIGEEVGITRERARQIEIETRSKLIEKLYNS